MTSERKKPHYILVTQSSHLKTIWRPAWFPWKGQFGGRGGATAEGWRPPRSHAGSVPVCFPLHAQDTSRHLHVKHARIQAQKENIDKGCMPECANYPAACTERSISYVLYKSPTIKRQRTPFVKYPDTCSLQSGDWNLNVGLERYQGFGLIIKRYMRTKWEPPQKPCDWNC